MCVTYGDYDLSNYNDKISADISDIKELSDEDLLFAARRRPNTEYTTELISRYVRIITIKANKFKKKNKRPDIEDLISEGFLGLLSAIRAYDKEKGNFSSFANICIENKMKSLLIMTKSLPVAENDFDLNLLQDDSPGADELLIEKESEKELAVQMKDVLSELEFKVLNLYIKSYKYKQIAQKLNISLKSVDNTLSRARVKLKKIL